MKKSDTSATANDLRAAEKRLGTVIAGRYKIVSLLGLGAMAAVYLVHHVVIRKRLAVKVLHPSLLNVPEIVARFEREALAAAHIDHPNVASAYDFGRTEEGGFFLVLEFIQGQELRAILQQGPMPAARTLAIAHQLTSALCLANELNIVHRDLKPENIMLMRREGQEDYVKILDFGLAKVPAELRMELGSSTQPGVVAPQLTKVGALYGTPGYMAPEQALSEDVDSRADLYSLGSILYEMLTGRPPFDGNTVLELIDEHLRTPLPPMRKRAPAVSVPEPVESLVRRLLAKRREDRFRDPRELLAALDQLKAAESGVQAVRLPFPDESLAMEMLPGDPAQQPNGIRKGTVVAMPFPTGSLSTLEQLQQKLPGPLSKIPLGWLLGNVLVITVLLGLVLWLLSSAPRAP